MNAQNLQVRPRFVIGDIVETNWTGSITRHTIRKSTTERISQSGVMYKISPSLGNNWGDWYDEAWFTKVGHDASASSNYS